MVCKTSFYAPLNSLHPFLLDVLIECMQANYRAEDLAFAEDLAEALLENFESDDGGFYFTSYSHETLIHRPKQGYGNATPNGNGIGRGVAKI